MVGIEVHSVFPYIEERVCVGLRKIFPLSMEVYFCDFGFDIMRLMKIIELMKIIYFLPQVDNVKHLHTWHLLFVKHSRRS